MLLQEHGNPARRDRRLVSEGQEQAQEQPEQESES